jgi:hypothetical protein
MKVRWDRIGTGLLLSLVVLGCSVTDVFTKPSNKDSGQQSRKSIIITINLNQRQEFFNQLHKFADANGFSIQINTLPSSNEEFQIYMTREDIFILGASAFDPGEYHLGFYDTDRIHPLPDSVFDDLVSELEQFMNKVPNTTFSISK